MIWPSAARQAPSIGGPQLAEPGDGHARAPHAIRRAATGRLCDRVMLVRSPPRAGATPSPTRPATTAASATSCRRAADGTPQIADRTCASSSRRACGTYPPHAIDQLDMYGDLVYATPGITAAELSDYFKDASFGVQAGQVERTYSPPRAALDESSRDSQLRRPAHLRRDARGHALRRRLRRRRGSPVLHGRAAPRRAAARCRASPAAANKAMDRDTSWAPYGDAPLHRGNEDAAAAVRHGRRCLRRRGRAAPDRTSPTTSPGSTSTSSRRALNPTKMPGEYALIGKVLEDWQRAPTRSRPPR